jgi:hypothetical protein
LVMTINTWCSGFVGYLLFALVICVVVLSLDLLSIITSIQYA